MERLARVGEKPCELNARYARHASASVGAISDMAAAPSFSPPRSLTFPDFIAGVHAVQFSHHVITGRRGWKEKPALGTLEAKQEKTNHHNARSRSTTPD